MATEYAFSGFLVDMIFVLMCQTCAFNRKVLCQKSKTEIERESAPGAVACNVIMLIIICNCQIPAFREQKFNGLFVR